MQQILTCGLFDHVQLLILTKHIDITSGNSITCTLFKIMIVCENGQIIAVMKSVIKLCNPKSDC